MRCASGGGGGGAPSIRNDNKNLSAQLVDLQRSLAFLANVTKLNLEQICLAAEEALKEQHTEQGLPVWSTGKNSALHELIGLVKRAQCDVQTANTSPSLPSHAALPEREAPPISHSFASNNGDGGPSSSSHGDELAKTHQLARLLQERNTMREQLMDAEGKNAALQRQLASLTEKRDQILQTVSQTPQNEMPRKGAAARYDSRHDTPSQAMMKEVRQMYDRRVKELEEELMSTREELLRMKAVHNGGLKSSVLGYVKRPEDNGKIDSGNTTISTTQREESMETLRRQNIFLRNKVAQLKEELQASQQAAIGSTEQLNSGLDGLLNKITELQKELLQKERQRADAFVALEEGQRNARRLAERVEELQRQVTRMRDAASPPSARRAELQRGRCAEGALENPQRAIEALEEELKMTQQSAQEHASRVRQLTRALDEARHLLHKKDVEREALQLELTEMRAMWEAAQAHLTYTRAQEGLIAKMEVQVREAVGALLQTNIGEEVNSQQVCGSERSGGSNDNALQRRLETLSERMRMLEGLDLQLRQKGDEIVILQDEKAALMEQKRQLQRTLSSLSLLFRSLPQSPAEVEELIVERDIYLSVLRRCERLAEVPNVKETSRNVELRKLELSARRERQQNQPQQPQQQKPQQQQQQQQQQAFTPEVRREKCGGKTIDPAPSEGYKYLATTLGRGGATLAGFRFPDRSPSLVVMEEESEDSRRGSSPRLHHCERVRGATGGRGVPSPEVKPASFCATSPHSRSK
ncbi:hypothetical protein DQ04_03511010 [Trypanosoma grayi]|uniref:hypothetical protein n=1 Tax=Trypanosoma grayi TaxID=71804 RepID=UPI0004F3F39F|nr:hypothetical protein DQ04_03511010 [Trypanosoma grayi]KEG10609.1 hypothetical protein DQ04_03511010 [Trypanosoma grayi]